MCIIGIYLYYKSKILSFNLFLKLSQRVKENRDLFLYYFSLSSISIFCIIFSMKDYLGTFLEKNNRNKNYLIIVED